LDGGVGEDKIKVLEGVEVEEEATGAGEGVK